MSPSGGRRTRVCSDFHGHMSKRDASTQTVEYKVDMTAVALANKVARIVFVLMAASTIGRSRLNGDGCSIASSPPRRSRKKAPDEVI